MSLHIVTTAPDYLPHVGGAEVGLHRLLSHSASQSTHRFSVVAATVHRDARSSEVVDGIVVRRLRRPRRSVRWYAPTAVFALAAPAVIAGMRPDVMHLSYALPTGPGGMAGSWLARAPFVLSVGGNDVMDPLYPPPRPLRKVAGAVARRAAHVRCWTSPIRDVVIRDWGLHPARTSVDPFGVDVDRPVRPDDWKRRARERWQLPEEVVVLLALQRLERRKGVDVLIDAIPLMRNCAVPFLVLVVGEGSERASLECQAAARSVQGVMRFLGAVSDSDRDDLMELADLLVVPSRHEGQGLTIAEAGAASTPAIATNSGGTVDMIDDGVTGYLVPPEDPGALAAAIEHALGDGGQLAALGLAARRKTESELSLERSVESFLELIERVHRAARS